MDIRGIGQGKTYDANGLTNELFNRGQYVIRILPFYETINEVTPTLEDAFVAYGRTYIGMCSVHAKYQHAPARGLCKLCREDKTLCRYQAQDEYLKSGRARVVVAVPQMLPYLLSIYRKYNPVIIIDDCKIEDIAYPKMGHDQKWLMTIYEDFNGMSAAEIEEWIASHKKKIKHDLAAARNLLIDKMAKGPTNLLHLGSRADFLAFCANADIKVRERKGHYTFSYFDTTLQYFRFIYQTATMTKIQRKIVWELSPYGVKELSKKGEPVPCWTLHAISDAKYTQRACMGSDDISKNRIHRIYQKSIRYLDFIKKETGREFVEFSQERVYEARLSGLIADLDPICHLKHYGDVSCGSNEYTNFKGVVVVGTLAPNASFFDSGPYLAGNPLPTSNNDFSVSYEVTQEITDGIKIQELGRVFRRKGEQEHEEKIGLMLGTPPKYEVLPDGTKWIPEIGCIVIEHTAEEFEWTVVYFMISWLQEAIINKALRERPVFLSEFSKEVAEQLQGISASTVQRILEKSGRFTIELRKVKGNNKPKKVIEWGSNSDVKSTENIAALLAD